jgi:hypothetical protein
MGVIAEHHGVQHLSTVTFSLLAAMYFLTLIILKKTKIKHV